MRHRSNQKRRPRTRRRVDRWIGRALRHHRQGALRRHYRMRPGRKIPLRLLIRDQHKKGRLGAQVRFALGRRGYYRKR